MANHIDIFRELILTIKGYSFLNTFTKKLLDQAILNEFGKTKKSQKLDKSAQVGTLKAFIVPYSTNAQK